MRLEIKFVELFDIPSLNGQFALHLGALVGPVVDSTHGGRTVKQPPCMFRLALRIVEAQGIPSVSGWGSVLSEMSAGKSSKSSSEASDML